MTAIRHCRHEDVEAVMSLWAESRSEHASIRDRREDIERLVVGADAALLVAALAEGEIAGALIAAWDGWRGNLYRLVVSPELRRQGIGASLVDAGEGFLRDRGARRITALVAFEDERAGAFWDSVGYPTDQQIGRRARNLE